ncbi:disease resistance protein RUN1-like [Rhodamnia argentea]|uniref:Disease resistance protein RUN1-like n=1 Tax=Rhodamnia argentea TaxID=178133 RepID=A0ABM3HDV9_9MYRT|nr:disease resistance protein RUN1-like [Rhodamnia argentea]
MEGKTEPSMAESAGIKRKVREDEPARLKQDTIELEVEPSMAEYSGEGRRRVEVEPARLNQDPMKLEAELSMNKDTKSEAESSVAESEYEVFLSFTGSDNLFGFVDSLHCSLLADGIRVFRGLETVCTAKELRLSVYSSKIYIPIFSRNYARSPRCLDALALMVEHTARSGGTKEILPVFYDVERFDVKLESSLYGDALDAHGPMWGAEKVEQWKEALVEANKVEGWNSSSYKGGSQRDLVTLITREISLKLKIGHNYEHEDLFDGADHMLFYRRSASTRWVQIKSVVAFLCLLLRRIRNRTHSKHMFQRMVLSSGTYSTSELEDSQESKVKELLELEVNDVRIVGIHGRDGIGKTALAKIVYDQISLHFDACSFLAEIAETTQQPGGVQYLQTKLIFDILKREYEAASAFEGVQLLKEIFRNMKVLIVLDDVERGSLLKKFIGAKLDWFGSGSRIIVTSKERSVLQGFVDRGLAPSSHHVIPMHPNRAFHFFWHCAIEKIDELNSRDLPSYVSIANNIVKAVKGLPLLLEVFGSFLRDKGLEEWIEFEDLIQRSQEDPQKILSRIYDALDEQQKQMYLDIACFPPDVDCRIASYMWHDYDHPNEVMEVLRRMSLIKTEENKVGMHSMLRCLAREIIRKGFHDPGTGVGLYDPAMAQGTNKGKRKVDHLNTEVAGHEILLNTTFLSLGRANDGGKFADALKKVRWLHWQGCPPDASNIQLEENENLAILELPWSKVTESWDCWNGRTMQQLKVLNLTGCAGLIVTPSFSCCPNLEMLILERCSRLVHLDPSINDLKLLVTLNLKFCSELTMLPTEMGGMNALRELLIDGTSVRELPASIGNLVHLQILSAINCFSLGHVPDSVWKLEALVVLAFDGANILELPKSIGDLKNLRRLSLRDCRGLEKLPESIDKLADSLEELDISGTGISQLPDSTKRLRNLKVLKMDSCFIRELPRDIEWLTNLEEVHASLCRSLEGDIPSGIWLLRHLRELRLRATRISRLPSEIQFMSSLQTLDLLNCNFLEDLPIDPPRNLIKLDINPKLKKKMLESSEFSRWSHLLC